MEQTGGKRGIDLNVVQAWKKGYTGEGVVVTTLDDGLYHEHPDLKNNYVRHHDIIKTQANPTKGFPFFSLSKTLYLHWLVLVGSRNEFGQDFTIELK